MTTFASGAPYPFFLDEAAALFEALKLAVRDSGEIDIIYRSSGPGLAALNLLWPLDILWTKALDNIALAGLLADFCVKMQAKPWRPVVDAATALLNVPPATKKRVLSDELLVLDREDLREALTALERDGGELKVVVVKGAPQSGKSHGYFLFKETALYRGAKIVYIADGMVGAVTDVIEELFSNYAASDQIPDKDTTGPAFYQRVCRRLKEVAIEKQQPMWIAVDGLGLDANGDPLLDPQIVEFFDEFAVQLGNPAFSQWFRLMLIHYPDKSMPRKWRKTVWTEDKPTDADIQLQHVEAGIEEWVRLTRVAMPPEERHELALKVIEKCDAPMPPGVEIAPRLQRINEEVTQVLRNLAASP